MRGRAVVVAVVVAGVVAGAGAARPDRSDQAPTGELLDTIVVQFSNATPVSSKMTLQRPIAYTLVVSGSGTQASSGGTVQCDAVYCISADTGQPFSRRVLTFRKESVSSFISLPFIAGKTDGDIPYDASHTYTAKIARDLDQAGKLLVRSENAYYGACREPGVTCSGSFTVKIYGPAAEEKEEDEHAFRFSAWASHPAKIRNPFGQSATWTISALSAPTRRLQVRYVEPDWEGSTAGRSSFAALSVGKTQLRRSGPAVVLRLDVTVAESYLLPKGAAKGLPTCAKGAKGAVVLIDDDRLVAGGEQKRGQTRDELHISVPSCPFLSHRITNADSLQHDPFVGGRKGSPRGGQWADVTVGANAAPVPETSEPVKTAAEALALVEKVVRAAADECEITSWRISVSGVRGLWKVTAAVTMAGKAQTALWNIVGRTLVARNAVAQEIGRRCQ